MRTASWRGAHTTHPNHPECASVYRFIKAAWVCSSAPGVLTGVDRLGCWEAHPPSDTSSCMLLRDMSSAASPRALPTAGEPSALLLLLAPSPSASSSCISSVSSRSRPGDAVKSDDVGVSLAPAPALPGHAAGPLAAGPAPAAAAAPGRRVMAASAACCAALLMEERELPPVKRAEGTPTACSTDQQAHC